MARPQCLVSTRRFTPAYRRKRIEEFLIATEPEIDRERQAAARLQKELDAASRKAEQGVSRHREEVQKLQGQLGDLRQQVGVLEGNLDALRTANARYIDEAAQAREQRDQLASSLTAAVAKQKLPGTKRTANQRASSGPVVKSPRTRNA
jgi:chromosome segregation ATPase